MQAWKSDLSYSVARLTGGSSSEAQPAPPAEFAVRGGKTRKQKQCDRYHNVGIIVEESLSGHNAIIMPRFKRIVTGVFVTSKWQVTDSFNNYNTLRVVVRSIRHVSKRTLYMLVFHMHSLRHRYMDKSLKALNKAKVGR